MYNEEYQYDANGNKTYADENGIITRYSYDSLNRISSVTENGDDITQYEYDGYNNISREYTLTDIGVKTKKYFYDGNNRLILSETEDNYITYDYDSAGNLIKKTDNGKTEYYGYDGYNRLNTYYDGYTEAEYEYNLSGLRKSKTVNGKRTRFVYSGADILGEITNDNYYIYYRGTELLGSKSYTGDVSFYRIDGHGSVTAVLSPTGEELKSYRYDAFGAKKAFTIPPMGERTILYQWKSETDGIHNPFGYCGEYTDTETGLIYLRNRYYTPSIGRFITEDPIKDGLNWYAYANNNPVMFVDYWGLAPSDHIEFGENSPIAKELDSLGVVWSNSTSADEKEVIHQKAELLRGLARQFFINGNDDTKSNQKKVVKAFQNVMSYETRIRVVSDSFDLDTALLATVVFRETIMTDIGDAKDLLAAYIGLDKVSVGLCQIQPRTARDAYDNWLTYLHGEPTSSEAEGLTYQQLVKNLNTPEENIHYAAIILWNYINIQGKTSNYEIFKEYTGHSVTGQNESNFVPYMQTYFN